MGRSRPWVQLLAGLVLAGGIVCGTAKLSPAQDASTVKTDLLAGPDFRVRVSAALFLGRTKPTDARFVLERALDDAHPAVRAAAAAALAQLGDDGAIPQLRKHLASEASGAVKSQLKASIETLSGKSAPAAPTAPTIGNARYVVQLGNMKNATNVRGESLGGVMRSAARARAATLKGALLVETADASLVKQAGDRKIPVLMLDGTITRLAQGSSNGNVMFQAQVEFAVRKVPQQTLQGTFSGAATTVDSAQVLSNLGRVAELQDRAVDGAVESAMRGADRGLAQAAAQK
jgi:HEAT repeats